MAEREPGENLLIVDDEPHICQMLATILTDQNYNIALAHNGREAIDALNKNLYSVCITDLRMPQVDGLGVLKHIHDAHMDTIGIVMTGFGNLESAVEAMRYGAFDYISKPFHADEINIAVRRALEVRRLRRENLQLKRDLNRAASSKTLIGNSPPMREVLDMINAVADSDSTVLILGESGTGKELVARMVHQKSPRQDKPLIPVNCGALPENLLESELFGHVKGAFTGAVATRMGRFQLADRGTIFLDEVGEMTPQLQVRLLRVLQEGQFEMVGAAATTRVDVRVIAATNRNLEQMVEDRSFREDLYYRLHVIPIHIAPLRERVEDVPLLIDHFIRRFNREKGRAFEGFDDEAMEALMRYPWPGNVRELENLIERCVILNPAGRTTMARLPEKYRSAGGVVAIPAVQGGRFPDSGIDLNSLVDQYETQLIARALDMSKGVKNRAAQLLNIKRTTLVEKMKKKGMAL